MSNVKKKSKSSFWAGKYFDTNVPIKVSDGGGHNYDLYQLSSSKRAIANFVNIITNENIPVEFKGKDNSYTDGKTVVIGSNIIGPEDFDVAVGLALHEGSHIKLTDFNLLRNLRSNIPNHLLKKAMSKWGKTEDEIVGDVKNIWNVVEDRRIDDFIYKSAPGYRGYYISLYDKYFNNEITDTALKSDKYTDETFDSYMFRIINLHNPNTRLDALKVFREIYKLIDVENINRLKSSRETMDISLKVFEIIVDNVDTYPSADSPEPNESGDDGDGGGNGSGKTIKTTVDDWTPEMVEALKKAIQQQKDFIKGNFDKIEIPDEILKELENIDKSGTEMVNIGGSKKDLKNGGIPVVRTIVVKKMTEELMRSNSFPLSSRTPQYTYQINDGIRMGTILGKRLQVRSEARTTIFNRQKSGKIDKRMLSALGYGNENVFQFLDVDQYNSANVHISIDASGSMTGPKWSNTLTTVAALCKAVDMIQNLEIQVSIRTTSTVGREKLPYVVMAYDSRVDKMSKIRKLFPLLKTNGVTPEGLCFEAIEKYFLPSTNTMDSYFINISDGEPYFPSPTLNYSGRVGVEHTRQQIKKLKDRGLNILSYYVSNGGGYSENVEDFKRMYGNNSSFIDVTSISEITKTMNNLFLKKNRN